MLTRATDKYNDKNVLNNVTVMKMKLITKLFKESIEDIKVNNETKAIENESERAFEYIIQYNDNDKD